ncbi:MAG: hypothetical protein DYG89_27030 [Caldilinea sp. CFX5]|nr:hypothetical protein [Caldilinea sp. CFX5]
MRTQYAYLAKDQQARPLGIRVVEPPPDTLQSARGRLYAVIEFADNTPEAVQQVERALSTIQRTYYTIKGTQSFVLGEALREALQQLTTATQPTDNHSDLGILLVALLDNRLLAVGAGAVIALFTNGGKVDVFPPGAIGATETGEPTFDIYRQDSPTGVAFLLAGNYCLEYFSLRELASTVAHLKPENLWEIVDALCQHADVEQLPGLLVVTESDDAQSKSKTDSKAAAPPPPRRPFGRLPAALQTAPPVRPTPPGGVAATVGAATMAGYNRADSRVVDDDPTATEVTPSATGEAAASGRAAAWTAALQQGVQQTKAFFTKILPERSAAETQTPLPAPVVEPTAYADQEETAYQSSKRAADSTRFTDLEPVTASSLPGPVAPAGGTGAMQPDRLGGFTPPARARGSQARLYILAALLILILTPVIVMGVYWSRDQRNQTEAEQALDMAEASFLAAAGALEDGDKTTARDKLTDAQTFILQADSLVGGRLPRGDELSVKIEREMANLLQVQPLYALAAPLVQFLPEAQPRRVIVNAQDIYVLDVGRQLVQYFQLDPTRTMVTNVEGEVIMQQGTPVDNVSVGALVDIAWQPPVSGVQDKSYLLVLDKNNNIFRYDRRVEGASRLALGGQEQLRTPVRIKVYGDRLYLADEGASQLFRYGSDFTQPPTPWFAAGAQSDLASLRAIDIDGDIWMLYAQGSVSRYRTGAQIPFSLEDTVGVIKDPVDIAVGDQSNYMVYVADRDQERILVYNKEGVYQHQFRAPEGHPLRDLQALFVDEVENTMYILTQSSLFKHPLTQAN